MKMILCGIIAILLLNLCSLIADNSKDRNYKIGSNIIRLTK